MASLVQAAIAGGVSPGTSVAATFGSNVTAGSRLSAVVFVAASVALTDGMMTDTLGNTWVKDFEFASGAGDIAFYSAPSPAGGACTVTFNTGQNTRHGIVIREISGIDGYSGVANSGTGNTANPATGAITPASANGIAIAVAINSGGAPTWEADYATGAVDNGTGRIASGHKLISSTASEEATGTYGGAINWNAAIAWYPDSAPAGPTTRNTRPAPLGIRIGMARRMTI